MLVLVTDESHPPQLIKAAGELGKLLAEGGEPVGFITFLPDGSWRVHVPDGYSGKLAANCKMLLDLLAERQCASASPPGPE